jgi:hypothetical protein
MAALALSASAAIVRAEPACPSSSAAAVADTIREIFAALSVDDDAGLTRVLAPDFYAFDAGRRFDGPALVALVKSAHKAGKTLVWTVNEPDVHIACDRAWIAYVNRGSVGDAAGSQPVIWQESANLRFEDGRWRIEFLHSNRVTQAP